jgi:hypothetical protein
MNSTSDKLKLIGHQLTPLVFASADVNAATCRGVIFAKKSGKL